MHTSSVNSTFILDISKILVIICIWVFLVNHESVLLLDFVRYRFSYCTQNYIFLYILEATNSCIAAKNCSKSYICVFISPRKQHGWLWKNFRNSGMVGRRKLPDHSLNRIFFNATLLSVQYTLWFQWTNFGLKCLVII